MSEPKTDVHSRVEGEVYQALMDLSLQQDRTLSAVIARILKTAVMRPPRRRKKTAKKTV